LRKLSTLEKIGNMRLKTCFQIFDNNNKCGVKSTQSFHIPIKIASIKNDLLTIIGSGDYDPKTLFSYIMRMTSKPTKRM